MNNQQQNQNDLLHQMQAIAASKTAAIKGIKNQTSCPNCHTAITDEEVLDNICWTCQKELDE